MRRRRLILLLLAGLLALLPSPACASDHDEPSVQARSGPIPGKWVDVETNGVRVMLRLSEVTGHGNVHFSTVVGEQQMNFMAYVLGEDLHVRANACPPCRSIGFALEGTTLVCDTCQTTFNAVDGSGIEGACVDYPKAAVAYVVEQGMVVMDSQDLVRAYDDTLAAG